MRSAKADLERGFLDILLQIQPKPALVNLFREVVLDVWKQRQGEVQTERQQVEKRLRRIVARKDRLVEEYVHRRAIDEPTFHRHMDLLSEQETLAKLRLHDAELDGLDVENVLAFAARVLTNMAESWNHMNPEQKRRFQSLIFPDGLAFDGEGFGTTKTTTLFKLLEPATRAGSGLASPRRFELRLPA